LPGGFRRHPCERIEVVDLGRDLRAERRWVEPIDPLDRRAARPKSRSKCVEAGPRGRDDADPRDEHSPVVRSLGDGFVNGREADSSADSASAIAANVASVLVAIGRVNARSTNHAQPGSRGRKSCSIVTRQPRSDGSIRHVTSIPAVAPPT
jgi:hypothetical protein